MRPILIETELKEVLPGKTIEIWPAAPHPRSQKNLWHTMSAIAVDRRGAYDTVEITYVCRGTTPVADPSP